jgi:citrate lyase subunit beta/citryl-CoA lyase
MEFDFDDNELESLERRKKALWASAGRQEKGDLSIDIERRTEGGIAIEVQSSVKAMFGNHIHQLVREECEKAALLHCAIRISDFGALDHVILARLEACLRSLDFIAGAGLLPAKTRVAPGTTKDRLRRSRLYIPGNNPDLALNAGLFGADCIILDLEDSVAPAEKDQARIMVRNSLLAIDFGPSERIVRINPLATAYGEKDLDTVLSARPDVILIPKCESKNHILAVEEIIVSHEKSANSDRQILLMPLVETAKGVLRASEIAVASERNVALCIGAEDLTADIGVQRTVEGEELFTAQGLLVLAAKAAGIQALDTVFSDIEDIDGLVSSAERARRLGFDGKGVIHPAQIKPVHRAFAPTEKEIEEAKRIIDAYQKASAEGTGVFVIGTKMIDAPVVVRAKKVLKMAQLNKQATSNIENP